MAYDTLVLSGGSIQGISLLGALQYFKDQNILNNDIKNFIGTSVGSVLCYLLIIGYTPVEIIVYLCINFQLFEKLKCFDLINASRGEGATTFLHISEQLEKMTIEKTGRLFTLKDLENTFGKKLFCVSYNITKAATEIISDENNEFPVERLRKTDDLRVYLEVLKSNDPEEQVVFAMVFFVSCFLLKQVGYFIVEMERRKHFTLHQILRPQNPRPSLHRYRPTKTHR